MKRVGFLLVVIAALTAVSCGSDKPWVGEWIPDSGNQDGVIVINSDGTAEYDQNSSDGRLHIDGEWKEVSEEERSFTIKFDPSTVEASADNPLVEAFLSEGGKALSSETITEVVSEDGERMSFAGGNGGYIRK